MGGPHIAGLKPRRIAMLGQSCTGGVAYAFAVDGGQRGRGIRRFMVVITKNSVSE